MTLLKVATELDAVSLSVLALPNVQLEVIVMVSVAPPDPPIVTVNAGLITTPAVALAGTVANVSVAAAEAAPTPMRATPARTIIDAVPMPNAERSLEIPYLFFITSPSSGRAQLSNTP
jgi:hypothetical protein